MRDNDIRAVLDALDTVQKRDCLSHNGLAHQVGCSTGHLSMIFAGKRRPLLGFCGA